MTRFGRLVPFIVCTVGLLAGAGRVMAQGAPDTTHATIEEVKAPASADSVAVAPAASAPETTQAPPETLQAAPDTLKAPPDTARTVPIPPPGPPVNPLLLQPRSVEMTKEAPNGFKVRFQTTKGIFVVQVHRDWAPVGADRFYNLVRAGYYDEARFFRVIEGFMAQFGISGIPQVNAAWREAFIADEPVKKGNTRGRVSFAKRTVPNTRTTQLFINLANNSRLDKAGFGALGDVVEGINVVEALYSGYGECWNPDRPTATGPEQARIQDEGTTYLADGFPKLDYIVKATIVK